MKKVYKYKSFDDDVVTNSGQQYELPDNYRHIRDRRWERILSTVLCGLFRVFSRLWLRFGLHARFVGREKLLTIPRGKGFFVYGNHTQELGDPMIAIALGLPPVGRRVSALCSPANLGIPLLGPLLPYIGAIPIAPGREGMLHTEQAISWCTEHARPVVIFPEAHVWPWYTEIRPFTSSSFHYPVKERLPVFSMTVTYGKNRFGHRPKTTIYIDGPWFPDAALTEKEQKTQLWKSVRQTMLQRAENSTYSYVEYIEDK